MRNPLISLLVFAGAVLFALPLVAEEQAGDHEIIPEDYFSVATVGACETSPDGKFAAYVESRWNDEGRESDLWIVDLASKERLRLTFDGFGPSRPQWGPEGTTIYCMGAVTRPGEKNPPCDGTLQVWRIDHRGGDLFPVTRIKDGVSGFELTRDGKLLYYRVREKIYDEDWKSLRKEYDHLEYGHGVSRKDAVWKLDLESWRAEKVLEPEKVIHDWALSPNGRRMALITTEDNELIFKEGWSDVEVLDLESKEVETLTSPDWRKDHPSPFGWLEEIAWAPDGRALAFSMAYDGYASRIFAAEWPEEGKPLLWEVNRPGITALDGALKWRPDSRTLCFRGETRARMSVHALKNVALGSQGPASILGPEEGAAGDYSFDEHGRVMALVLETTKHFNEIYRVVDDRIERITDLNPQTRNWKLPQISLVSWAGADGDEVEGILELPSGYVKGDGPLPLVVELHGGPTASTQLKLRFWIYGRTLFPAKGYALFSPNYHGSTGYGDEFTAKLIGRENEIEVTDIRTGIEFLIQEGIADPEKIGVMGWSNGGYLTNCMITAAPELFKAASSGAGILDMVIQWGIEDTPGHVINYMQGLPWEKPEAYAEASPLYELDRVKTPTLIHVGGGDPRVPPAHSRALYRALRHYLMVPVELVVYPGEGHGLSTRKNRLAKMKWDLAWFDRYLLGKEEE